MDTLGGVLLYLGLIVAALGAICVIYPLRRIGIRKRKTGLLVVLAAFCAFAGGVYLPARELHVHPVRTHLDEFIPVYQFGEFHSISMAASKGEIHTAIHQVRAGEIRYFSILWRIRFFHPPDTDRPILDWFTSGGFQLLADGPDEVLFGFERDRYAPLGKVAMNFRITEVDAGHCLLTTETRVYAVGFHTLHAVAAYWRMIRPGSALIRRMWLRAIKARSESAPPVDARFRQADSGRGSYRPSRGIATADI